MYFNKEKNPQRNKNNEVRIGKNSSNAYFFTFLRWHLLQDYYFTQYYLQLI